MYAWDERRVHPTEDYELQRIRRNLHRDTAETNCHDALASVIMQTMSRNKALDKQEMWKMRYDEEKGDETTVAVIKIVKAMDGANVTANNYNKYEKDRVKN